MISLLYEKMPDKNYTGIDITPKMIEAAKAKNLERYEKNKSRKISGFAGYHNAEFRSCNGWSDRNNCIDLK